MTIKIKIELMKKLMKTSFFTKRSMWQPWQRILPSKNYKYRRTKENEKRVKSLVIEHLKKTKQEVSDIEIDKRCNITWKLIQHFCEKSEQITTSHLFKETSFTKKKLKFFIEFPDTWQGKWDVLIREMILIGLNEFIYDIVKIHVTKLNYHSSDDLREKDIQNRLFCVKQFVKYGEIITPISSLQKETSSILKTLQFFVEFIDTWTGILTTDILMLYLYYDNYINKKINNYLIKQLSQNSEKEFAMQIIENFDSTKSIENELINLFNRGCFVSVKGLKNCKKIPLYLDILNEENKIIEQIEILECNESFQYRIDLYKEKKGFYKLKFTTEKDIQINPIDKKTKQYLTNLGFYLNDYPKCSSINNTQELTCYRTNTEITGVLKEKLFFKTRNLEKQPIKNKKVLQIQIFNQTFYTSNIFVGWRKSKNYLWKQLEKEGNYYFINIELENKLESTELAFSYPYQNESFIGLEGDNTKSFSLQLEMDSVYKLILELDLRINIELSECKQEAQKSIITKQTNNYVQDSISGLFHTIKKNKYEDYKNSLFRLLVLIENREYVISHNPFTWKANVYKLNYKKYNDLGVFVQDMQFFYGISQEVFIKKIQEQPEGEIGNIFYTYKDGLIEYEMKPLRFSTYNSQKTIVCKLNTEFKLKSKVLLKNIKKIMHDKSTNQLQDKNTVWTWNKTNGHIDLFFMVSYSKILLNSPDSIEEFKSELENYDIPKDEIKNIKFGLEDTLVDIVYKIINCKQKRISSKGAIKVLYKEFNKNEVISENTRELALAEELVFRYGNENIKKRNLIPYIQKDDIKNLIQLLGYKKSINSFTKAYKKLKNDYIYYENYIANTLLYTNTVGNLTIGNASFRYKIRTNDPAIQIRYIA